MPELPDLEVFKENIYNRLTSKNLVSVSVYNPLKVSRPQDVLNHELQGKNLAAINRFGKELLFDFADGRIIAAHLMLSGRIAIVNDVNAAANIKFKIISLNFENESIIFSDIGGLCTIKYKPLFGSAPDAFGTDFTQEYFLSIARKRATMNIKAFLIDQKVVKGIGNAYVDEILWHARISPHSIVGKIPEDVMAALYNAIGTVLKEAVASIKSITPDIISGEERSFLRVHNKLKKQTETGFPIIVERIVSKITYFTKEQVLYG